MNIKEFINQNVLQILNKLGYEASDALISKSNRPDLSDYQSNVAMALAKKYHKSPVEIAQQILSELSHQSYVSSGRVDGPGFINIRLSDAFLISNPAQEYSPSGRTVVIDYGGPNIAKEMHVGHLRSAIIGESIKRIMRAKGDKVIGDVHFGDWGTPIGMLIAQLKREQPTLPCFSQEIEPEVLRMSISEISALYRRAAANFKEDETFKEEARVATFDLQKGKVGYIALWKMFKEVSVAAVKENYDKLGVSFDLWMGESDVNERLPVLVEDLIQKGLLVPSEGALIVPLPEKNNRERAPLIVKKSDGAYTYAATDLVTIIQRVQDFRARNILYVVDARQREHFEQVFEVARLAHYVDDTVSLEYIPFGTVNGADGKPFKTRAGGVMNLKDLIQLAEDKARENIPSEMEQALAEKQAHQIAIGALKYQDLKNSRTSDYIFDTENFTKSEGKTGAYIQYAIARINSILEKSQVPEEEISKAQIQITHPLERELMLNICREPEALNEAYGHREPSVISDYVYSLAQNFSSFYAELSINGEKEASIRLSRLKMIHTIKEVLKANLALLGIESPDKMISKNKA